jgi:hypothetical protein
VNQKHEPASREILEAASTVGALARDLIASGQIDPLLLGPVLHELVEASGVDRRIAVLVMFTAAVEQQSQSCRDGDAGPRIEREDLAVLLSAAQEVDAHFDLGAGMTNSSGGDS